MDKVDEQTRGEWVAFELQFGNPGKCGEPVVALPWGEATVKRHSDNGT